MPKSTNPPNGIKWEDPPQARPGRPNPASLAFLNELRKHPRKWAVAPFSHATAAKYRAIDRQFKVVNVDQGKPTHRIHMRFVPGDES